MNSAIEVVEKQYDGGYAFPRVEPWTENNPVLEIGDLIWVSGWAGGLVRGEVKEKWLDSNGPQYLADLEVAVNGGGYWRVLNHRVHRVERGDKVWERPSR